MAKRASESMTVSNGRVGEGDKTAIIRGDIERTRGDMTRTVNEIEERLSPAHLKEQVASVTEGVKADIETKVADLKESVLGSYHEMKDHLKADIGREARDAKHLVSDEFTHARHAVRAATVGRVEHMVHDARETVTDAGTSVLDTIKANPIPAALIGVGLGWLIFGAKRSGGAERTMRRYRTDSPEGYGYGYGSGYGYAEGREMDSRSRGPRQMLRQGQRAVGEAAHAAGAGVSNVGHRVQEGASHLVDEAQAAVQGVGQKVNHLVHDAGERVEGMAGDARQAASHLAGDARRTTRRVVRGAGRGVRRAEQTFESTMRENPLALGAVAIAIGAAIGLALPHTETEDEWMGETKERLIHRAEGMAGEAIHKAEEAVGQLTAGEKGGDKGEQSRGKASTGGSQDKSQEAPKNGIANGLSGSKSQAV